MKRLLLLISTVIAICLSDSAGTAEPPPWVTPSLPGGQRRIVFDSRELVTKPFFIDRLQGFTVARQPPTVIFSFLPDQDHSPQAGCAWSYWGEGTVVKGRYYTAYGDHGLQACVVEWNPETGEGHVLADTGYVCNGTFGLSLSEDDSTIFVTWCGFRPAHPELMVWESWDVCAVSAIRIPAEERRP